MRLLEKLKKIKSNEKISFHMPGHKNGRLIDKSIFDYDITEIPGADNLHHATESIKETEEAISTLYQSAASKMLVNGSTVGILSMILGMTYRGDQIFVNRHAHQSIYHAMELGGLKPIFLAPEIDEALMIPIGVSLEEIKKKIKAFPDIKIMVLTYPSYEGLSFDIKSIIDYCHKCGLWVLIDEAHGAHFLLSENLPKSSLDLGADIVVQSFHKTLPALNQTACIHFNHVIKASPNYNRVLWHLKALQTSSPSYVLMASIDAAIDLINENGYFLMDQLNINTKNFICKINNNDCFEVISYPNQDFTKLILAVKKSVWYQPIVNNFSNITEKKLTGVWLSEMLSVKYGIQPEYENERFCLLMTSIATTKNDFDVLEKALDEISTEICQQGLSPSVESTKSITQQQVALKQMSRVFEVMSREDMHLFELSERNQYEINAEWMPLKEALGCVSLDYLIPYPPGIPLVIPGEYITQQVVDSYLYWDNKKETEKIKVVKDSSKKENFFIRK